MYTIKQAAARSGLSVPTVRVWERRYGVVRPERTPTGYRVYDDGAIDRLIAMRYLVEGLGVRPSQAAQQLAADGAELDALLVASRAWTAGGGSSPDAPASGRRSNAPDPHEQVASFVDATRALDLAALDGILDEAFAIERFEGAIDRVVFPALRAVGDGWANGSLDVAMEHAASEVVRRRLAHFHDAAAVAGRRPTIIAGLPPGSRHDIGVLAFAVAARRAGLDVLYLGADVPVESWARAFATTAASVAVIGVVTMSDVEPASRVVASLRALPDGPTVFVGGRAARAIEGAGDDGPLHVLPDRIEEAVDVVARRVGRGS